MIEKQPSWIASLGLSYHSVYEQSIQEALQLALDHGFDGIQLALEVPHLSRELHDNVIFQNIVTMCKKRNLYINLHGYDYISSLYSVDPILTQAIFAHYQQIFQWASLLHSPIVTIHLGLLPTFPQSPRKESSEFPLPSTSLTLLIEALKHNLKTLVSLIPPNLTVCIENYNFHSLVYRILKPYLNSNKLSLCWDLPKTFSRSGEIKQSEWDFLKAHHQSIKQIHVHDLHPKRRSHLAIGEGILDFKQLLTSFPIPNLQDVCFEIRPFQQALISKAKFLNLFSS